MPKILQINVSLNGSTGQICQSINQSLLSLDDESRNDEVRWSGFIIHGARYGQSTRKQEGKGGKLSFFRKKTEFSESQIMQIGNIADEYIHYAESLLLEQRCNLTRKLAASLLYLLAVMEKVYESLKCFNRAVVAVLALDQLHFLDDDDLLL